MIEQYKGQSTGVGRIDMAKKLKYLLWVRKTVSQGNNSTPKLYDFNYMLEHGSCQTTETYQWGFSYIFLFMVSIFNFVWSCIMVGMWFDTTRASRMYKSGRRPGLLRSVLDLSRVIREELGDRAEKMEEDELRSSLTASGGYLLVPRHEAQIARTGTDMAKTGPNAGRKRTKWRQGSTF
jgi:hypothetical protein